MMGCPCGYRPGDGQTEMSTYYIRDKSGAVEFIQVSCNGCNKSVVYHRTTAPEVLRQAAEWAHTRRRWTGVF